MLVRVQPVAANYFIFCNDIITVRYQRFFTIHLHYTLWIYIRVVLLMQSTSLRVLVTGAAGQIAYSLLYSIAKGDVFGQSQVSIHEVHLNDTTIADLRNLRCCKLYRLTWTQQNSLTSQMGVGYLGQWPIVVSASYQPGAVCMKHQ